MLSLTGASGRRSISRSKDANVSVLDLEQLYRKPGQPRPVHKQNRSRRSRLLSRSDRSFRG